MTITITNSFEGGTNGTAISVANSGGASGTAFDSLGGSTTLPVYSTAKAIHGSLGASTPLSSNSTTTLEWKGAFSTGFNSSSTPWYARDYFQITSLPPAQAFLMKAQDDVVPQDVWAVYLDTTGHLGLRNRIAGTNLATSTGTVALNTPTRWETKCVYNGTTYNLTLRCFFGSNVEGATPDETLTGNITTADAVNVVAFGAQTAAAHTWSTVYHDDIGLSTAGYLGPATVALNIDVADTVTATVTAGIRTARKIDVSQTVTAGRTLATTRATKIAVSDTITASRTAAITALAPGTKPIDVSKTLTASITPGTKLAAVLAVNDTITASRSVDLGQTGPPPGLGTPYTIVSGSTPAGTSTIQVTVEANAAAGDSFVVGAGSNATGAQTVTKVEDSQGNVYTLAKADYNQLDKIAVFVALNVIPLTSGVDWIKATYSSTGGVKTLNGRGCAGIAHTGAVDVAIANDLGSGTAISVGPSATLAQGSEWAVAFAIDGNGGGQPTAWTGGFTARDTAHLANNQYQTVADQIVSATSPLTAGATIVSAKWAMVLVTLKAGGGTPYLIDVAETVTAAVTTNDKLAAVAAVTDSIAATVTASINGKGIAVAQTITASRTAGIAKNAFTIDVHKTLTATVTDNARRGRPIAVSQSLTMPVTTGFRMDAVAAVNDILTAAISPGPNHNAPIDVALTVTASDAASVSFGAVQVLAQWTESAVNDYGVSILGINNTPNACLAAFIGWSADDATRNPIVYVADDAHNYWVPLEVSDPNSLQRGAIWVCTNAQVGDPQTGITTVTVSSTLPTAGIAFNIVELSNMPPTVVLSGLESSGHSNATTGLTASGSAVDVTWGFALYVSDGPTATQPGSPWGALATGSTFNPGQGGGGLIDVATTLTASVTANVSGGHPPPANTIAVSKVVSVATTAALTVTTPPPNGGNPALLYAGANAGPQGGPNITNFTDMLTGANGLPDMGPMNCQKVFYSAGVLAGQNSSLYKGILGSFSGGLEQQILNAQPGCFIYVSWNALMPQAGTQSIDAYVSSIPSTDRLGNRVVVGFTFQSEMENAYPAAGSNGAQFVSDWKDQVTKIRSSFSRGLSHAQPVFITSHYMPAYGSDGGNSDATSGNYMVPIRGYVDVWGADFYQNELASDTSWSSAGISNSSRWSNWESHLPSNPQIALSEYGVKPGKQVASLVNSTRLARFQADWATIQKKCGPGGTLTSQPLYCFLFWNTQNPGTANTFTDGATVAFANSVISSAMNKGVNGK